MRTVGCGTLRPFRGSVGIHGTYVSAIKSVPPIAPSRAQVPVGRDGYTRDGCPSVSHDVDILGRPYGTGMNEIHTSIEIDASAETVWSVLTEFGAYPEWNPYTRIEGEARVGERLRVSPGPDAGRAPTFRPRVLVADGRELRWLGHLYVSGLFDGEHSFVIEELEEGRSRLVQSEEFSGLLAGPIMRFVGEDTETNFRGVNEALAARAESLAGDDASVEGTDETDTDAGGAHATA